MSLWILAGIWGHQVRFSSLSLCCHKKWWFVCLPCVCQSQFPPEGAPSISQPHPPPISLDIMGNAAGGGGHPNHSEDLTHLSHSELNIAVLSSSDSAVVHQPPGLFGGKGPQKEDKDGSARSLTDVRKGLERDQRKKDKHLCCASIQGEAMVYGIEARADSMCNSEKTALGEIYWRGVIKKEKQAEIWPDPNDSMACSHSGPLLYFRQSASDKVVLFESVLQSATHRDTHHIEVRQHIHRQHSLGHRSYKNTNAFFFSWKRAFY